MGLAAAGRPMHREPRRRPVRPAPDPGQRGAVAGGLDERVGPVIGIVTELERQLAVGRHLPQPAGGGDGGGPVRSGS